MYVLLAKVSKMANKSKILEIYEDIKNRKIVRHSVRYQYFKLSMGGGGVLFNILLFHFCCGACRM